MPRKTKEHKDLKNKENNVKTSTTIQKNHLTLKKDQQQNQNRNQKTQLQKRNLHQKV